MGKQAGKQGVRISSVHLGAACVPPAHTCGELYMGAGRSLIQPCRMSAALSNRAANSSEAQLSSQAQARSGQRTARHSTRRVESSALANECDACAGSSRLPWCSHAWLLAAGWLGDLARAGQSLHTLLTLGANS